MSTIIDFLVTNPLTTGLLGLAGGTGLIWIGVKIGIGFLLSDSNLIKLEDEVDKYVDKIQAENEAAGKLVRARLIKMFRGTADALEAQDGCN